LEGSILPLQKSERFFNFDSLSNEKIKKLKTKIFNSLNFFDIKAVRFKHELVFPPTPPLSIFPAEMRWFLEAFPVLGFPARVVLVVTWVFH